MTICPHAPASFKGDLESLPSRMRALPVDERGYVVPWFVDWVAGKPEFRAMSGEKFGRALKFKLCWVCGEKLGRWMTFVAGPMCGINRTSAEPPSHQECARWSARNCPFLNNPDAIRRTDETITNEMKCAGFGIPRNPGVTMLWTTDSYTVFRDGKGGLLLSMGEPKGGVEWLSRGRQASRAEIMESIETGLPTLAAVAQQEEGALAFLKQACDRFERYLPAA